MLPICFLFWLIIGLSLSDVNFAYAAILEDPNNVLNATYDFIIVGAGTAGSVVASRLTEDSACSVLIIEAGTSDENVLDIEVPFLSSSLLSPSSLTWNYSTVAQEGLDDRTISYVRGKVFGGSSSTNFLGYTRGSDDEYDRWANITMDSGWSWTNLEPFYRMSERLVDPADGHNTSGQVDPDAHGYGPIEVSVPGYPTEIDDRVILSSQEPGDEFLFNLDLQGGTTVGFGLTQSTIGGGERCSAADAYLHTALNRSNIDLLTGNTGNQDLSKQMTLVDVPAFKTVEFAQSDDGTRYTLTATKGRDTNDLEDMGITPIVDLPDVGKNLHDHPQLSNYFVVNSTTTLDDISRDSELAAEYLEEWENDSIFELYADPSSGTKSAHYEMVFANGYSGSLPSTGYYLTVNTVVLNPVSNGTVTLASTDPFDFPIIDPGFLTSPLDIYIMISAVKGVRQFIQASPWDDYVIERYGELGEAETDEEIEAAIRNNAISIWHPSCTARMSAYNATDGVVNPDLTVKGVSGLRIVDASVFPKIPAAHLVGPVYIVAEKGAQLIRDAWGI
ncbi:aryl-alcohol-oxidase from pleurotus Eryingii [Armillaria novae-zelandiae]|uniref:Aryl-alcohol-oxidase from pleurotus Eryingii n=1 Tax=Armillaria novae-zelandiae TaxID=153914 RepID=A0AA39PDJ2_9AGAR|nr:aryl-alcohol-oxidase from pleurotus Eryingii [Armillaria novae-zelandiae]